MYPTAAESDRVADGGSAQVSGGEPVSAGATEAPQRRRRPTRPAQRHCGTAVAVVGKRAGGNQTAHPARQTGEGSHRPGRSVEAGPDIPSAGCAVQRLRRCGGAGVARQYRQCEVSEGEVLRSLHGGNLSGAAPRRLPWRIRSESEELVPAVLSFVQYDGAKDRGSAGEFRHRDFQRPDIGVADGRIPGIQEEKQAIVEAGLASSPWQHMDDTGIRVDGENHHCQILCNPLYGAYFTTVRKDRLTIIDVLRNGRPRIFRLNEEALDLLHRFGVSQRVSERVGELPFHQDWSEEEFEHRLAEKIPDLSEGPRSRIAEAAALAAYHAESGHVRLLVCDDARQFKLVADELALCWIHDGRHYQSMTPCVPQHREWLEAFRKRYWDFYRELLAYRQVPAPERAAQLREKFDELFSTVTGYDELDQRITRTRADKTYLLMVLSHPEVPLHNNPAELDARTRVRKRVVSYGPRSLAGARTWDAMETLLSTARKLGVNFFQYIRDRVSGARQMPSLADLIKQRAETMVLGSSWTPT